MGVEAILVMWPGPFEQSFVPPSHGGSIWNLTLIGQAVSEEKKFNEFGRRRKTTDDDHGRTTQPAYTISSLMSFLTQWANNFREQKKIFSGSWGDLGIIFREHESTDTLGGGGGEGGGLHRWPKDSLLWDKS